MTKSENFKLIEGTFSYDEANEIIKNIFNAKIQFHELKNFSSKERLGKEDERAVMKINQLKIELEKFKSMLKVKENKQNKVVVSSSINISFETE
jgi:predicted S18 family serine protease